MDKKPSPAFRTALSGFNKEDVNDYITKLSVEFDQKLSESEGEIANLKAELEAVNKLLDDAKAEAQKQQNAIDADENIKDELLRAQEVIASNTQTIDEQKLHIELLESELAAASEKIAHYTEIENKIEEYETMSARMGDIFMGATKEADRIRAKAQADADELIRNTEKKCDMHASAVEKSLLEYAAVQRNVVVELFDTTHKSIIGVLDAYEKKAKNLIKDTRSSLKISFPKNDSGSAK